jgi:DNA repair protein RecN (Recombination protein N)
MLTALCVRDFVLIENLELRLEPGFNVITGETGAGKSIVVGALGLVLGGRARAEVVRPGAREAVVEAMFDAAGAASIEKLLERAGIPFEGELLVRRVVQKNGRSRAYINGRLCTVAELTALGPMLADVTSQHESVALTDARRHIDYLDRYADLLHARDELGELVDELLALARKLAALRDKERSRHEREAFLRFSLEAIRGLAPRSGELGELRAERSRLKHASQLGEMTGRTAQALEGDGGVCDQLGGASSTVAAAAALDPDLEAVARDLEECWSRVREAARVLTRYAERVEADPARLEEVQDRVFRLEGLLRQHGPEIEDVLSAAQRMEKEIDELVGAEAQVPAIEERRARLHAQASTRARKLSRRRREVAEKLGQAISNELSELGMGSARVVVEVSDSAVLADGAAAELAVDGARLGRDGVDRVQFLIAPNRGAEPRPLARIASGGELSRALLALKRALGENEALAAGNGSRVGVQVFDEVDSGVGGDTALRIGRAIADIARHRQVLCITHMAAIAAFADAHFVVTKRDGDADITTSAIARVDGDVRIREVARMLTGANFTPASRRAAQELLATATAA